MEQNKRMNTMRTSFQLLAVLAVSMLVACGSNKKEAVTTVNEKPKVKLAKVSARPVDQIYEYTATVEAEIKNNIAPSSPVRIDNILVEVGDYVKKGQKLVSMDQSRLVQSKLQLENQRAEYNRINELYKIGGVSESEWEASRMTMEVQESAHNNLLENTSLLSPINGLVTVRNYDDGDLYDGVTPVLSIEQITPVKIVINISESYFPLVKKGASVDVRLDVYKDEVFEGKVSLIYPTVDPATRTFPVEIKLPNIGQKVRPGMFARATMNFGTEDHVVVPDVAIIKQIGAGDRYVYVYENGKVNYTRVELGRRMGDQYELLSGVNDQALVVVAGQARLTNGAEVDVEE